MVGVHCGVRTALTLINVAYNEFLGHLASEHRNGPRAGGIYWTVLRWGGSPTLYKP